MGLDLERHDQRDADQRDHRHDRGDRVALLLAVDHPAEGAGQRERDAGQQEDLDPVGPRGRVLEGMRGVGVEESAAVGAEQLDGLLAGDRAAGDGLLAAGQRVDDLVVQVRSSGWLRRRSRMIAAITDSGNRIRMMPRTRSTQKLPRSLVLRRASPRTNAMATAMPTAAETKFCTARPAICTRWPCVDSPE